MTGPDLLHQLDFILDSDPLIDEVGFVHPSQFAAIDDSSMSMESDDATDMAFWSRDHKLGISINVMHTLYTAAKCAFMSSLEQYRKLIDVHAKNLGLDGDNIAYYSSSLATVESYIMKHSRVLLLLSCDFGTAWNCRKEVVVKKHEISLYLDELRFSSLVLSYSPKSERAWSHRRWVIKMIASKCTDLQKVLKNESELAERIAEVIDELVKYRDWAGLHVADNSCFHYRTRLMTRTLEDSWHRKDLKLRPEHTAEVSELWKEELAWCEILIKRYIGREALWLYRRFLSLCWIKHFAACMGGTYIDIFMDNELQLFHSCTTIPDNVFEDYQSQALFAATYMMWLIKQMDEPRGVGAGEKVREELEEVLNKVCPQKAFLWDLARTKNRTLVGE